jgi:hypothetical protein
MEMYGKISRAKMKRAVPFGINFPQLIFQLFVVDGFFPK